MNKGYIKLSRQKITETRKPPQVKSSKSQIYTKFHKIPGSTGRSMQRQKHFTKTELK